MRLNHKSTKGTEEMHIWHLQKFSVVCLDLCALFVKMPAAVRDRSNRPLHDLRVSLTDRCNFRCPLLHAGGSV